MGSLEVFKERLGDVAPANLGKGRIEKVAVNVGLHRLREVLASEGMEGLEALLHGLAKGIPGRFGVQRPPHLAVARGLAR